MRSYKEQFVRKVEKDLNVGWLKEQWQGTSLAIQWLRLHASPEEGQGLIPDWETKILHATQCGHFFFFLRQAELRCIEGKEKDRQTNKLITYKQNSHICPQPPPQTSSSSGRR